MLEPFTIRIFVADGNPEGIRIIDRMNWTGQSIVFPRSEWVTAKNRDNFLNTGIYILVGYESDDELPDIYIGQSDILKHRIDQHVSQKDFWDWAICFISGSNNATLNRAHVTWLEWALIQKATEAGRSHLKNNTNPSEPNLSESEKADMKIYLKEIYQILPLVGLRAFERPRPIIVDDNEINGLPTTVTTHGSSDLDTIIVPAREEGFNEVFLGKNAWYAIRISQVMLKKLKWIAAYQTAPVSAITHIAEIESIVDYGEEVGKYKINFRNTATQLAQQIPFGEAPPGSMQGPRYTTKGQFDRARTLADLVTNN